MLKGLVDWFSSSVKDESKQSLLQVEVAACLLMLEVAQSDGRIDSSETALIKRCLQGAFELSDGQVEATYSEANSLLPTLVDFHQVTSRINQTMAVEDKVELMTRLWQVAAVDGNADSSEQHFLRKVAGLLHLRHSEYIQAKLQGTGD